MSIWGTQLWLDIPERDQYGSEVEPATPRNEKRNGVNHNRPMVPGEAAIDISRSGMSDAIRFSVMEQVRDECLDVEVYLSADEARAMAATLNDAADWLANRRAPQQAS